MNYVVLRTPQYMASLDADPDPIVAAKAYLAYLGQMVSLRGIPVLIDWLGLALMNTDLTWPQNQE